MPPNSYAPTGPSRPKPESPSTAPSNMQKPNAPASETSSKGLGTGTITGITAGTLGAVGVGFTVATFFNRWKTMLATTRVSVRAVELTSAMPDSTISITRA